MSAQYKHDSDIDLQPLPGEKLSANGQWIFGTIYAALILVGFSFGVWVGASKSKPAEVKAPEVAEAKKENTEKPPNATPPGIKPPAVTPPVEPKANPMPTEPDPLEKPKEPEPKPKEPEPKPKEPEPKPKEPEPKPKEPEPKKVNVKPVAFKEVSRVFVAHCNNCHGAVGKPKAGIDLRTIAGIMKGGEDGAIVKAGEPEKSLLYISLTAEAPKPMPPEGKPRPTEAEIKLVHDWIASGAKPRRTVRRRGIRVGCPAREKNHSPKT